MATFKQVLIVGRPNVGKSTLVNRLLKKNKAITLDQPGVTRDLSSHEVVWKGKPFILIDSGGVLFRSTTECDFQKAIDTSVKRSLESVDTILFLVDSTCSLHPLDKEIAKELMPYKEKVVVAVNKIDNPDLILSETSPYYQLGLGTPFGISAHHGKGISEMLNVILRSVPKVYDEDTTDVGYTYKVSIIGRPNVGKSSLVNAVINEERMIVSDIAGTTRDAVDIYFNYYGDKYVLTDTAGLRKKSRIDNQIEFYSSVRTKKALIDSELIVCVIDIQEGINRQDKRIISEIIEMKKNMIVFVNKWDTTERTDTLQKDFQRILYNELPQLENYPVIFGSALEKFHIGALLDEIPKVISRGQARVQTSELNQFIEHVIKRNLPPSKSGKRLNILYGTQVKVAPPSFLFFVNHLTVIGDDYYRFIEKRIRQQFGGFLGNTVEVKFKQRKIEPS